MTPGNHTRKFLPLRQEHDIIGQRIESLILQVAKLCRICDIGIEQKLLLDDFPHFRDIDAFMLYVQQ
jgi:hypothetical protein